VSRFGFPPSLLPWKALRPGVSRMSASRVHWLKGLTFLPKTLPVLTGRGPNIDFSVVKFGARRVVLL